MRQKSIKYYLIIVITLLLSACGPGQSPLIKSKPVAVTVEEEASGNYLAAAEKYLALAQTSSAELQTLYQLKAAELFVQMGQIDRASPILNALNTSLLSEDRMLDYRFLYAQVYLDQAQAEPALQLLDGMDVTTLSVDQQKALYSKRIQAYELTQNWLEKANTHLALDPLLLSTEQSENRKALWYSLMQLTPEVLDLFNPGIPPQQDGGWFALAYTIRAYETQPEVLQVALDDWKRSYPNHPADPELYASVLAAGTHLPTELSTIAVLLPSSGPYAEAANVIKQGLIAAHFNKSSNTQLKFFDITNDELSQQSNVVAQYQRAVQSGAQMVIGPLQKSSVDELVLGTELAIPVLALNRIDDQLAQPNLYQFGLAPEDDAVSIANFAIEQGYQRAIVLTPMGDWGDRIASAFAHQWRQNGGQVIQQRQYDPGLNDYRDTLIPLMGLDVSKQRYQKLKQLLGGKLEFEPRRRQDIDFIFLVAKPLKARQLVPQFKFHRSGDLPIIATSHAYSGEPNPQQDIDLNNLIITDMPWLIPANEGDTSADGLLLAQSAQFSGSLKRLFALGVDAYQLIPQLNLMSRNQTVEYMGATGTLSINAIGQVERKMPWAQFKQGTLTSLP